MGPQSVCILGPPPFNRPILHLGNRRLFLPSYYEDDLFGGTGTIYISLVDQITPAKAHGLFPSGFHKRARIIEQ